MKFNNTKQKLRKIWNRTIDNGNIIITKNDETNFFVQRVSELNNKQSDFNILHDFSSDWVLANTVEEEDVGIIRNVIEFRVNFKNVSPNFIPYIHGEIIYRSGLSGTIPIDDNENLPFDEEIGEFIKKTELFKIKGEDVEYITSMYMEQTVNPLPEVEYKFICHLANSSYYSDN